jgi:hypothetical protein
LLFADYPGHAVATLASRQAEVVNESSSMLNLVLQSWLKKSLGFHAVLKFIRIVICERFSPVDMTATGEEAVE